MPKYLFQASYTTEGLKGLLKEGGSSRRDTIAQLVEGLGGSLESFYYAFGENDVIGVGDLPDNATAAAFSMAINASGAVTVKTVVLMTPEEADEAAKKTVAYRPPGQ
jgi:uncharacterized protein with GYD domain